MCEGCASALDSGKDLGTLRSPYVGLWIGVAVSEIALDVAHQFIDRSKAAGADRVACQIGEEALDLIEPGRRGRREVHVEARVLRQPMRQ